MSMLLFPRRGRFMLLPVVMAAMLSMAGGFAGPGLTASAAIAADASSDIPGVALPGSVATGRLGGSIYDVVYRFSVAPGYVIVASLTGSSGTDFDLYLFDASATTVLSSVGLLTKSIGATSTESISWPSRFGGTYYVDLNGATNVEGDFRLTLQAVPDPTPPQVAVVLAEGKGSTNELSVGVALNAADDLSGVADMAFSMDGVTYSPWLAFRRASSWTFPPGDGPRTLWAKVRNGVGLESPPGSDTVEIDTAPPSAVEIDPPPGSTVAGLRPRFTVTFSEAMDEASWNDLGLIVQSATGALISGTYAYDAFRRMGSFVPLEPLQAGSAYVVTIGDVRDVAGNRALSPGSWSVTVTPLAATITLTNSASVITWGEDVTITAQFGANGANRTFILERTRDLVNWFTDATLTTDASGRASFTYRPATNNYWRALFLGTPDLSAGTSNMTRTVVRQIALLRPTNGGAIKSIARNTSITFTTTIRPSRPELAPAVAEFRFYRLSGGTWTLVTTRDVVIDSLGKASTTFKFTSGGSWYVRSRANPTPLNANSYWSPVERYNVR